MTVVAKNEKTKLKSVYNAGSSTWKDGYALCYNQDLVTGGSVDNCLTVEKPATANLPYFAGAIAEGECGPNGRAGPGWYRVNEPDSAGRVVPIYTKAALTANTTVIAIENAKYDFVAVAAGKPAVGIAMQTGGTSTGAALIKARLGNAKQYLTAVATGLTNPTGGIGSTANKTMFASLVADVAAIRIAK